MKHHAEGRSPQLTNSSHRLAPLDKRLHMHEHRDRCNVILIYLSSPSLLSLHSWDIITINGMAHDHASVGIFGEGTGGDFLWNQGRQADRSCKLWPQIGTASCKLWPNIGTASCKLWPNIGHWDSKLQVVVTHWDRSCKLWRNIATEAASYGHTLGYKLQVMAKHCD